jgi:transport system permease protein
MSKNFKILLFILSIFALFSTIFNLNIGFAELTINDFLNSNNSNYQVAELRLYRILTMFLVGISVPTSGFVLQEYFKNPLVGSEVLGISSVASLSVAIYIFGSQTFVLPEILQNYFINISAILGSIFMLSLLLLFSKYIFDKSFLIIFGFLISSLSGAIISLMQFYADNQSLKNYILWSFGANNQLSKTQLFIVFINILIGLFLVFKTIRLLIGNSLGEQYALSFGINLRMLKYLVIISTSILSSSVTAFIGNILFIGIIVPHFCRLLFNPSKLWHQWCLNMILGISLMEFFSAISEKLVLPINITTSLFGIPIIVLMLLKKKN